MSDRTLLYNKLLVDDSSFGLIRTNPKLTGNLKIAINESGDLWLESIKANQELSKDVYSKFPIDTNISLPLNIFRFFKGGETPNEIIFDLVESVDTTKTSKNYKDQFDFSHYFSGAKYLASKKYTERLSYFAPLYLKNNIPNFFIILKIEDPANFSLDEVRQKYEAGQSSGEYALDLFKKSTIIKTFDLRPESKAGKYIRDYIDSLNFPASPLSVSFGENDFTTWNGILIDEGSFGSRGELLYDFYRSSSPLKFFEENITAGYSRNGVIFPNILNLEFVFNDESSEKYDFNRYIGFYVNTIELSKLDIDLKRGYANRGTWENSPRLRKEYLETDEVSVFQENSEGVIIPYKNLELKISEFNDLFSDVDSMYLTYVNDKDGRLYSPKITDPYLPDYSPARLTSFTRSGSLVTASLASHGYQTDDLITIVSQDSGYSGEFLVVRISDDQFSYIGSFSIGDPLTSTGTSSKELNAGQFRFSNKQIDLGLFFGPNRLLFLQDQGESTVTPGHSHIGIKINSELLNYDEIKIYHPNGTRLDSNGTYDLITIANNYGLVPGSGDYYAFNDYDEVIGYDVFYINGTGYANEIANALTSCLNSIRNRTFTAYAYDDRVFIKVNVPGEFDLLHKILFVTTDYSNIEIDFVTGPNLAGNILSFSGGSKEKGNRLILDANHLTKINQSFDSILVKSSDSWSKIRKVSQYVDLITEENQLSESLRINAVNSYLEKIVVVLDENEEPTISYKEFVMRPKFRPSFGLLSFFQIKDIDFDFYSSLYTNFPQIDLYNYYFIPENYDLLEPGIEYSVSNGSIVVNLSPNGIKYPNPTPSPEYPVVTGSTFTVPAITSYSIASGSPLVRYSSDITTVGASLISPINDQNEELIDFPGFSLLKDPEKVVPQSDSDEYRLKTKYLNGITSTEYDYYKENESLDFALRSKMIPYITKWGIKNGKDSRDNPYRLNTELIFSRNNFSPDHEDRTQNPENFTHEWFYIESKFNYANGAESVKLNSNYFETPFSETSLLSDPEYFINYFTYTPSFSGKEVGDTQFRYSSVFKNNAGQYDTFFKGFKLTFKDVTDSTVLGEDGKPVAKDTTDRFEGYRFSCLLKPVKERIIDQTQAPIKYKVIEHKDFKFILIVIEVAIGGIDEIEDYWKEVQATPTLTTVDRLNYSDPTYVSELGTVLPFDSINGDYRVSFDSNDVSNVTHTLLYSLKNKKYNVILNNYSTTRMGSKLSLAAGIPGDGTIKRLQNVDTPNYLGFLTDDISKPTDSTFIAVRDTLANFDLFIDTFAGPTPQNINPITGSAEQFLSYDSNIALSIISPTFPYTSLYNVLPSGSTSLINNYYTFRVVSGGEKYFEKLLEKISFGRFKQYLNSLNPFIEYFSYSLDSTGATVLASDPKFYLEVLDQSSIEKVNQVISIPTDRVPVQFSQLESIGFDYELANLPRTYSLNRYKGEYEPVTRNLLAFNSRFEFNKNQIADLTLGNVKINGNIDEILSVSNFNHIKVANNSILDLESDDTFVSRYQRINEIAIGQADYFLLRGNWDWGFHFKYSNKGQFSPVSGALRVEEDECFVSKLLTLPEFIELENFQITQVAETAELNSVDISQAELVVKETPIAVEGYLNISNALTRYLVEDGISAKFDQFLINSNEYIGNFNSIEDYVRAYIDANILKLYEIYENVFFVKENAALTSTVTLSQTNPNSIEFVFLNDQQRFAQGYDLLKAVQINKRERLVLKFNFRKKPGKGLSISPKIKIKFI
jgi:hypothetical protein